MKKSTILNFAAAAAVGVFTASAANLQTVATFDALEGQVGENLVFDVHENLYVTLALSNEVVKIAPNGTQTPYATFNGPAGSFTTGLVIDDRTGDLFVGYVPAGQASVIYVVHPDQSKAVIATFPVGTLVNGMTPDFMGNIYVADSFGGYIWRVKSTGGTPEIWSDLHFPGSQAAGLGPNGLKFDLLQQNLFVTVPNQAAIYRIPKKFSGDAGAPVVFANNLPSTLDDLCLDVLGNVYVTTQLSMSVLRISPNGAQQTVASAADGLQRTSAVLFGRGASAFQLYILSGLYTKTPDARNGVYRVNLLTLGFPVSIP
jgi:sugar lactone lactonase YvrE